MTKPAKPIRTDRWRLLADAASVGMAADTVVQYRRLVDALTGVFVAHWKDVHDLPVQGLERLFHATAHNPSPRYGAWFCKNFPKFPAYLRRAATMAAHGSAASLLTRYRAWQGGDRRLRAQRPPRLGKSGHWPVLYAANGGAGAMIRHDGDAVSLKLYDKQSGDWLWRKAAVVKRGKRHGQATHVPLSPTLIVDGSSLALGQPYEFPRPKTGQDTSDRACAVDLGVNKQATCAVLDSRGTVLARRTFHLGTHIDRRDKLAAQISHKARQTMGEGGKLSAGFCQGLYRRAKGLNTHMARTLSQWILQFAADWGASTVVFEDLQGFRPKGGRKRSPLKQRFHGWLHRALVGQAQRSGEERGVRVVLVPPRGTSAWAYDGSGKVVRFKENYSRCRFAGGKEYDCDLNAAYNIGARWFARRDAARKRAAEKAVGQKPAGQVVDLRPSSPGDEQPLARSRRKPAAGPRMPVTLSTLWAARLQAAA